MEMGYMFPSVFCSVGTMVGGTQDAGPTPPPPPAVPVNTVAPALDDTTPEVGDTLGASAGTWTNAPTSFAWLWYRDGVTTGATTETYDVTSADIGGKLKRRSIASNAAGDSSPVFSNESSAVPTPPFVPTDIAGCLWWIQANQLSLSNGDPVATWPDLSGNANDATASGSERPTFVSAGPEVHFDGTGNFMSMGTIPLGSAFSIFALVKQDTLATFKMFLSQGNGTNPWLSSDSSTLDTYQINSNGGSLTTSADAAYDLTNYNVVSFICGASGQDIYVNGTSYAHSGSAANAGDLKELGGFSGAGFLWNGPMKAIVVYDSALGATDRQAVEAYLAGL